MAAIGRAALDNLNLPPPLVHAAGDAVVPGTALEQFIGGVYNTELPPTVALENIAEAGYIIYLVTALWLAAWIWRWFVQPAIVWCRGARPRRPLHRHPPTLRAHSGGGGRPAGVRWLDHGQFWGSDVRHGVVPVFWQRNQEGEDTGADENRRGHGSLGTKRSGDARAMQAPCKGATPAMRGGPRGPSPGSHTDQELT